MLAGSSTEYSIGGWISHRPEYGNPEKEVASRNLWELDEFMMKFIYYSPDLHDICGSNLYINWYVNLVEVQRPRFHWCVGLRLLDFRN